MNINYMSNEELSELLGLSVEELEQMDEEQREAEEFFEEDYTDAYSEASGNMPCDTYGMCAGTACPRFFQCQ